MTNRDPIELRAARLVLEESIDELRSSVHPCDCASGKSGDGSEGVEVAQRILDHKSKIEDANQRWVNAFNYYNEIKKKYDT